MQIQTKYVNNAIISPDNKHLISVSNDQTLRLWNIKTAEQLAVFYFDSYTMNCDFSADGRSIIAGDMAEHVHHLKILNLPK